MAVTYTPNYGFAQFDPTDASNWGLAFNGMLLEVDSVLAEIDNPLVWEDNTTGRLDGSELLTYDGEVLTLVP